jgi:hypothetical protein
MALKTGDKATPPAVSASPESVETATATAPTPGPKPDGIVINPARESRKLTILTIEEGPEVLAETTVDGDASAVIGRVLEAVKKHGVTVIRVWQHGEGKLIAEALRQVAGLKVLELK